MTHFPLLRLPFLPLKVVLYEIEPIDLTNLYLCSEKTSDSIKATKRNVFFDTLSNEQMGKLNALELFKLLSLGFSKLPDGTVRPSAKLNITVIIDVHVKIKIESGSGIYDSCLPFSIYVESTNKRHYFSGIKKTVLKICDGFSARAVKGERKLYTFWDDKHDGIRIVGDYLKKVHNQQIKECCIYGSKSPEHSHFLKNAVKWMSEFTIMNCVVRDDYGMINDDDYKLILDNIKPTQSFQLFNTRGRQNDKFEYGKSIESDHFDFFSSMRSRILPSSMAYFPLFRLPFLPLKVVFNEIKHTDLASLWLCSEKTSDLIKAANANVFSNSFSNQQRDNLNALKLLKLLSLGPSKLPDGTVHPYAKLSITVTINTGVEIKIESDSEGYYTCLPFWIYLNSINKQHLYSGTDKGVFIFCNGISVPTVMEGKRILYTFWDDQHDGIRIVGDYLKKVHDQQIKQCHIYGSNEPEYSHFLKTAVKWIGEQTVMNFLVRDDDRKINDDDYKLILDSIEPTQNFHLFDTRGTQSDQFEYRKIIKSNDFKMHSASWFTIDNLLMTDCEHINLKDSKLTNDELSEYVNYWMIGSFTKLKSLTVQMRECVNFRIILEGLSPESTPYSVSHEENNILIKKQDRQDIIVAIIHKESSFTFDFIFKLI